MPDDSPLIQSLRTAVAAAPADVPLRLHLAELLLNEGRSEAAVAEAAAALQHAPGDVRARELMMRAMEVPGRAMEVPARQQPPRRPGFDWKAAEEQVGDVVPPRFVESPVRADGQDDPGEAEAEAWDVEAPGTVRLADVGGMREVKDRLEAAFLAPLRNPELRKLYGKSLRGGLLLYGPPGCGKTFIARAVAGELGASFLSVSVNDVLDMWIGNSERNMHEIFQTARRRAPCVVFLDELDALGAKRSRTAHSGMRNTVNQLLTELDGISSAEANEGVFVLAATNVPWDVDNALRRPGRLDRTLLVLPPDGPAREAILRYHLRERPIENVDLGKLAKVTDGLSGADLAHVCEAAAERALLDSARSGTVRMIGMKDLLAAAKDVVPSAEPWFASARNVAMFANEGGMYDDLVAYLKKRRKL
ncbi:cell division control protein 48 CDC48 [Streptomyces lincolnensis]|uniref:Cell division control protein 48 CDC48 n=1 Tax=Streptomyces lincolnensis TaxID=1915 RepID=A0A1B1MCS1_STRLN|nr:ATP-binding protein [Streptomyces lincolnensis]ANS66192.1 cell division control protein 48 CDC48 [Streptomyces lincolnensis]AXG55065.1 cell division control protein 48 [Streptomyces lincolnensis]QMV08419.1 tetratricopeptide repeat protein [Streptomyces lincolnensis]